MHESWHQLRIVTYINVYTTHILVVVQAPLPPPPLPLSSLKQQRLVAEGVEDLHGQCPLPQWLVAVQEPHQHGEEDLALRDLQEQGRAAHKEGD